MADKDFRKLKRWELIEIIEGLQKDLQETTEENGVIGQNVLMKTAFKP